MNYNKRGNHLYFFDKELGMYKMRLDHKTSPVDLIFYSPIPQWIEEEKILYFDVLALRVIKVFTDGITVNLKKFVILRLQPKSSWECAIFYSIIDIVPITLLSEYWQIGKPKYLLE